MATPEHVSHAGRAWAKAGLGEHASVAAFARLVLDLLTLGAPPGLVQAAIQAMADEVEHACLCFGLAKRFTGIPVGPGPMDLSDVFERRGDPASILRAAILEGCFGETIAARCAQVALDRTEEPCVRTVLERIASDEAQHAELSWRLVSWVLQAYPELRPIASACFVDTLESLQAPPQSDMAPIEDEAELEKYGHLCSNSRRQVAESLLRESIAPRITEILGCSPTGGAGDPHGQP